ncbi:MAG: hypothetical protein AAGK04_03655 [Planctomycetota bacterium]
MRVGLVTCVELPEPDFDAEPLDRAIRSAGHEPVMIPWDDPSADPTGLDVMAFRSCWNYHERCDDFLAWVDRAGAIAPILNAPRIARWNAHKRYLLELQSSGVPIVPTELIQRGQPAALPAAAEFQGGLVVKPAIGAGSVGARRFDAGQRDEAARYLAELSAHHDALVQPLIEGFSDPGERSIVWIDGDYTHAILKRPRFAGEHEAVRADEPPTREELELAEAALAMAPERPAYARIDVVRDGRGRTVLSELELLEPSLFFKHGPHALDAYVSMLERHRLNA